MLPSTALYKSGSSVKRAGNILCKHCPCPCPPLSVGFTGTRGLQHWNTSGWDCAQGSGSGSVHDWDRGIMVRISFANIAHAPTLCMLADEWLPFSGGLNVTDGQVQCNISGWDCTGSPVYWHSFPVCALPHLMLEGLRKRFPVNTQQW